MFQRSCFIVILLLTALNAQAQSNSSDLKEAMKTNIVHTRHSDLLGPGVTTDDFYDQLEDYRFGIGDGKPKPTTRQLHLLEPSFSMKRARAGFGPEVIDEIREEWFEDLFPGVPVATTNQAKLDQWMQEREIPEEYRKLIRRLDRQPGAPFLEEWIQYRMNDAPVSDYPKLLRARDLIRRLLALDYFVLSVEYYEVEAKSQIFYHREKWTYGVADFVRSIETKWQLDLDVRRAGPDPHSMLTKMKLGAAYLIKKDPEKAGMFDDAIATQAAMEQKVKDHSTPGCFESMPEAEAKQLITEINQAIFAYSVRTMDCPGIIKDQNADASEGQLKQ